MATKRSASAVLVAAMVWMAAGLVSSAMGQSQNPAGQAQLVVTANGKKSRLAHPLSQNDIEVKVKNRPANIVGWAPFTGSNDDLQLVFLFDDSSRMYLTQQIPALRKFIEALPPSAAVGVAYMQYGNYVMARPMTKDHMLAAKSLRVTLAIPGISGSPYFCLSQLAKHWPSKEPSSRRVAFMVTNGEDPYYPHRDLQDPYLRNAIEDTQKAGLLVYTLYFGEKSRMNQGYTGIVIGQNYLLQVATATGGDFYQLGLGSPVSFEPFLDQFRQSLDNQYLLTVTTADSGWLNVSAKSKVPGVKLVTARTIYIAKDK